MVWIGSVCKGSCIEGFDPAMNQCSEVEVEWGVGEGASDLIRVTWWTPGR